MGRRKAVSVALLFFTLSNSAFAFSCGNCAKEVTQWAKWAQQLKMMTQTIEDWTKQLNYMEIAGRVLGSEELAKIFPEASDWTIHDAAGMADDMFSIYRDLNDTLYTLQGLNINLDPQSAKDINNWMREFERLYPGYAQNRDDPCNVTIRGVNGQTKKVNVCANENISNDMRSIGSAERVLGTSATAESAANYVLNKQSAQASGLDTLKKSNENAVGLMQAIQTGNAINLEIARGQQLLQTLQAQVSLAQLSEIEDRKQKEIDARNTERAFLNYRNPYIIDDKAQFDTVPLNLNIRDNIPRR
jgi:P-type conjugative transfer protein TrbJ